MLLFRRLQSAHNSLQFSAIVLPPLLHDNFRSVIVLDKLALKGEANVQSSDVADTTVLNTGNIVVGCKFEYRNVV